MSAHDFLGVRHAVVFRAAESVGVKLRPEEHRVALAPSLWGAELRCYGATCAWKKVLSTLSFAADDTKIWEALKEHALFASPARSEAYYPAHAEGR
jgi:hypothetical protein